MFRIKIYNTYQFNFKVVHVHVHVATIADVGADTGRFLFPLDLCKCWLDFFDFANLIWHKAQERWYTRTGTNALAAAQNTHGVVCICMKLFASQESNNGILNM